MTAAHPNAVMPKSRFLSSRKFVAKGRFGKQDGLTLMPGRGVLGHHSVHQSCQFLCS